MIGRILWASLIAVLALITAQLQLDRQSAREPVFARFVADPFRANAQFVVAARALYNQETERALAETRKLVERRPIPAEHLTLLAGAYYQGQQIEPASLAVQFAAQRGWRDPVAQEARLRLALEAGDRAEGARRFVALKLNRGTDQALLSELGLLVFASPAAEAETVMIDLASETDRWHTLFLGRGLAVMPSATFARVISASIERGTRFDCAQLLTAVAQMDKVDPVAGKELRAARTDQCPGQ